MNRIIMTLALLLLAALLPGCGNAVPDMNNADLLLRLKGAHDSLVVLDVRSEAEYATGHVPGAINIPHDQLPARLNEIRSRDNAEFVVYCETGRRAAVAQSLLQKEGFLNVRHLEGDMAQWRREGKPTEK